MLWQFMPSPEVTFVVCTNTRTQTASTPPGHRFLRGTLICAIIWAASALIWWKWGSPVCLSPPVYCHPQPRHASPGLPVLCITKRNAPTIRRLALNWWADFSDYKYCSDCSFSSVPCCREEKPRSSEKSKCSVRSTVKEKLLWLVCCLL